MTDPHSHRILIVLAGHADAEAGSPFDLQALAGAYYALTDRGVEVVLASSVDAPPRVTALRQTTANDDALMRRFRADRTARDELADVLPLDGVVMDDFDAVICIGVAADDPDRVASGGVASGFGPHDKPSLVLSTSPGRPAEPVLRLGWGTSAVEAADVLADLLDRRRS